MARTPTTAAQPVTDIEILPGVAQSIIARQDECALAEIEQDKAVRAVALRLGYQLPADSTSADLIQRDIVANMRRSVEACLEVGKGLAVLKEACGHGNFLERLDDLKIEKTVATRFMLAATKFSNIATSQHLANAIGTQSKLLEMLVLDDEQVEELALTGQTGDLALDDVATMSVKELRAALRKEKKERNLLEKVNKELHQEAQRIRYEEPDSRMHAIIAEATGHMRTALGLIDGQLRSALLGLTEDGMGDNSALAAGLVGRLQKALIVLRDELNLPNVVGDGKPEWQQWDEQQEAKAVADKSAP